MLTRVWALGIVAALAACALAGATSGSSSEYAVDAVLVMIVGPGEGVIGLDPDSRVDFPYVLPTTQRVLVRATITDANGVGVNGRLVTAALEQPGHAAETLSFTQNTVSGVYTSNAVDYRGDAVTFRVAFDLTPEIVEKAYAPLAAPTIPKTV